MHGIETKNECIFAMVEFEEDEGKETEDDDTAETISLKFYPKDKSKLEELFQNFSTGAQMNPDPIRIIFFFFSFFLSFMPFIYTYIYLSLDLIITFANKSFFEDLLTFFLFCIVEDELDSEAYTIADLNSK